MRAPLAAGYLFAGIGLLVGGRAHAQDLSLFSVQGGWTPAVDVEAPADVVPEVGTVEVLHFDVSGSIPIPLVEDTTVLLPGISYGMLTQRQTNRLRGEDRWVEVHELNLNLLLRHAFSPEWDALFLGSVGLSGDYVNIGDEHFRWRLLAMLRYRFGLEFVLGGGLLVNWQSGDLAPAPALSVDWRPDPAVRISGLLPANASFMWRAHDRLELGVLATIRGNGYALTSDEVRRGFPCEPNPGDNPATPVDETMPIEEACFDRLAYSRGEVGPTVGFRLAGPLWFTTRVSFLFLRRYELVNENGDVPNQGAFDLPLAVAVETGLQFRIPEGN